MPGRPDGGHQRAIVKLAIYWGLWLAWPAALWLCCASPASCAAGARAALLAWRAPGRDRRAAVVALRRAEPAAA